MPSIAPVSAQSRKFARAARLAVLVGCGVAVAGCTGAVETWRSLKGSNRNDPDPVAAPFTGNMAGAEAAPFPNLASVPPPPSRATTIAERQQLTEKLIAERAAAAQAAAAAANTAAPGTVFKPPSAPVQPVVANTMAPAALSEPPPAPARLATAMPQPRPAHTTAAGEPNQALPRDSELRMPQVRSLPEPDDPRPPPPPPRLRPVPSPTLPTQLPAPAIASAAPQPPPPVPELASIKPPPAPDLAKPGLAKPGLATSEPPRPPAITTVAMFDALEPGQIAQVAVRYKESLGESPGSQSPPRAVRVIAYTAPPSPGADPLGGYHDALERAQGVARALSEAGIPAKIIQTEAKPAAGPIAAARVEIQFLP